MFERNVSRRRVLRASAAAAAGLGGIGTASAVGSDADAQVDDETAEFRRLPCRDLSDVEFRAESVSTAAAIPERAGGVRPGSQMFIHYPDGTTAGCTANFVWADRCVGTAEQSCDVDAPDQSRAGDLYIGAAGHCFLPGGANASENARRDEETDDDVYDVSQLTVEVCADCTFGGLTGLSVVDGATIELGEVVYARQNLPDGSQVGHDFGIVRIPADKRHLVEPSMPQWGGPNGTVAGVIAQGEPVHQYGAGVGNGEVFPTMGSSGVSQGPQRNDDSWVATMRASPGDSGSPLVTSEPASAPETGDDAAGILTHLVISSNPAGNGTAGTTVDRCIEMTHEDVGLDIGVVLAD